MKKLIIVGALCMLSSYLYAAPSLGANAYTQLQSEGPFLVPHPDFESYVPFQTTKSIKTAFISMAVDTKLGGITATSVGLGLLIGGAISLGLASLGSGSTAGSLAISGGTFLGIGTLITLGGAVAWGIGARQLRLASFY